MEENCKKCNDRFIGKAKIKIKCGGFCEQVFHEKCTRLPEYDLNIVRSNKNIAFICDDCLVNKNAIHLSLQEILKSVNVNKENIAKQEKVVCEILAKLNSFNPSECQTLSVKKVESYASVVNKCQPVILKPKTKQSGHKTKEDLKKNVNPTNLKISDIAARNNGVVEIMCESEGERDIVKSAVEEKLSGSYDIKVPVLKKPKIFITGISESLNEMQIERSLKEQNEMLSESEVKCIMVMKAKKKDNRQYEFWSAVVELDSKSFQAVMGVGKVNIGWDRCRVYEQIRIKRCFKCLGFNHESKECTNKECCRNCGGEHNSRNCEEPEKIECVNCVLSNKRLHLNLDVNHKSMDYECPVYRKKLDAKRSRIFY